MSSSHYNGMSGGTCIHLSSGGPSSSGNGESDRPSPEEGSPPEVLGSVVHCHEAENGDKNCCIQLRTSARVSKKLRLDSLASQAPPEKKDVPVPKEEEKVEKSEVKPKRRPWELWPLEDKNIFFEALNEYGKDFDAIQKYFETKAKRRNIPESTVKNKEQIRHFYYRTWHKISKHLKFPDEVKKGTQELYGLINFGELRKKIGGVSEKTSLKLNELIYRGYTKIRIRGKTVRIKTPICRALRKLNQQEELAEELKLPTHVTIELRPRTNEAWARVQSVAQNPRMRTLLPLQRRLSTLIAFLEHKWQPRAVKHCLKLKMQLDALCADITSLEAAAQAQAQVETQLETQVETQAEAPHDNGKPPSTSTAPSPSTEVRPKGKSPAEPLSPTPPKMVFRVAPSSHVAVTPLTINLSDYFTSTRLSLNSHEERLGNHGAEELFNAMVLATTKSCNRRGTKRQRLDSFSDKKQSQQQQQSNGEAAHSAEKTDNISNGAKSNNDEGILGLALGIAKDNDSPFRLFGSEVNMNICNGTSSSANGEATDPTATAAPADVKSETPRNGTAAAAEGGAAEATGGGGAGAAAAETRTTGDSAEKKAAPIARSNGLTRMADDDEKSKSTEELVNRIRAGWTCASANALTVGELYLMFGGDAKIMLEYWWEEEATFSEENGSPAPATDDVETAPEPTKQENKLALTLQKLLSIVKLHEKQKPPRCPCGHVCNGVPKPPPPSKPKAPRPIRFSSDTDSPARVDCSSEGIVMSSATGVSSAILHDGPFRRPLVPSLQLRQAPMTGSVETFTAQLEKFRPRYCNRRGRPATARKTVIVPRMLPLLPKAPPNSSLLAVQVLPQTAGEILPSNLINIAMSASGKVPIERVSRKLESLPSLGGRSSTVTQLSRSRPVPGALKNAELLPQPPIEHKQGSGPMKDTPSLGETPVIEPVKLETEKVEDVFPSVITDMMATPVASPPSISNLLDMSLSSELGLQNGLLDTSNFSGLLNPDGVPISSSPSSPSRILKEDENQWLNSEVGDFSLSSFLGRLQSPLKKDTPLNETTANRDIIPGINPDTNMIATDVEGQMQCLMAENSLDYIGKFADLAAQIAADGANKN